MVDAPPQNDLGAVFIYTYEQTLQQLVLMAPKLLVAVALLLTGWAVASLFTRLGSSFITLILKLIGRFFPEYSNQHTLVFSKTHQKLFGKVIFWIVMFFFIAAACNVLGLQYVSRWLDEVFIYFPRVLAGVVIITGGYILSQVAGLMVNSTVQSSQFPQIQLFAKGVQAIVFFAALVIGIEQLGVDLKFITQLFIACTTVLLAGFSLAFALGARQLVENILGMQQVKKSVTVGDQLKLADMQGRVIDMSSTMVVLEDNDNTLYIPGHLFNSHSSLRSTTSAK